MIEAALTVMHGFGEGGAAAPPPRVRHSGVVRAT
jgi:hypothetical protein